MKLNHKGIKSVLRGTPILRRLLTVAARPIRFILDVRRVRRYNEWLKRHAVDQATLSEQRREAANFPYRPLISIIVPTYSTPGSFFNDMLSSVINQTYDNWELILVDDASPDERVRSLIDQAAQQDSRISKLFLSESHHIAGATNKGIEKAKGEFVSLFDHDDILHPDALYEVVSALNKNRQIDLIYTDEDKIVGRRNRRRDPFFKPNWNPDLLWSINYITHFTTIRKRALDEFGYEIDEYKGAQDWELFLRITRSIPPKNIYHIPKLLYSWRVHKLSTAMSLESKPYVIESQRKAIEGDLRAKGYDNYSLQQDELFPGQWRVTLTPNDTPKVTLLIVESNSRDVKKEIQERTTYQNCEIVEYNKDTLLCDVIKNISGSYFAIINENVNITSPEWIDVMLGDAEREDIGFVAAGHRDADNELKDIISMINPLAAELVRNMSHKEISRHYYATARHNLPTIRGSSVVMVELKKLLDASSGTQNVCDIETISAAVSAAGYRNLYNPTIRC